MSMPDHHASPPRPASGGGLLWIAIAALVAAVLFVGFALMKRAGGSDSTAPAPAYPTAGRMPADFQEDHSPEAEAFKVTCSQCHVLPSPYVHDEAGWRGIKIKMQGQMADRGISIPERQIDLAISYMIRHSKDRPSPASRPSYVVPPPSGSDSPPR